jgi:hypothetical protein
VYKRQEPDWDFWLDAFRAVAASSHHRGENDRGWTASLRWTLKDPAGKVSDLVDKYRGGKLCGTTTAAPVKSKATTNWNDHEGE